MPASTHLPSPTYVNVIVDTEGLLAAYPSPSADSQAPTLVDDAFCYLIGPPARTQGQATAHLYIAVPSDADAAQERLKGGLAGVQWRCFSLSGNTDQSAVLYGVTPIKLKLVATRARALETCRPSPVLVGAQNTAPPTFDSGLEPDYFIETVWRPKGVTRFDIQFYVTRSDPETGQLDTVGYFRWASEIAIRPA